MLRTRLVGALVLANFLWAGGRAHGEEPEPRLRSSMLVKLAPIRTKTLEVRLEGGFVLVKECKGWATVTLAELQRTLAGHVTATRKDKKASPVLDVRVHSRSPWRQLAWVVHIALEEHITSVRLRCGAHAVDLNFPKDSSTPSPRVPLSIALRMHISSTRLEFGSARASSTELDQETVTKELRKALRRTIPNALRKTWGDKVIPVLWVTDGARCDHVVQLLAKIKRCGAARVDLLPSLLKPPTKEIRAAKSLNARGRTRDRGKAD